MQLLIILTLATLATSLISGVLSMAGGMILMGVFGLLLPVSSAMVLHGVAQTASNGSRIWLYRSHINWSVLAFYAAGAAISLMVFVSLAVVTNRALLFILIGSFPFVAYCLPKNIHLDIEHRPTAVVCGVV